MDRQINPYLQLWLNWQISTSKNKTINRAQKVNIQFCLKLDASDWYPWDITCNNSVIWVITINQCGDSCDISLIYIYDRIVIVVMIGL